MPRIKSIHFLKIELMFTFTHGAGEARENSRSAKREISRTLRRSFHERQSRSFHAPKAQILSARVTPFLCLPLKGKPWYARNKTFCVGR